MGVLACSRNGCESIMCDYYSYEYGYICSECLDELRNKPFTDIKSFMQSPKPNILDSYYDWEERVEQEFKSRWRED